MIGESLLSAAAILIAIFVFGSLVYGWRRDSTLTEAWQQESHDSQGPGLEHQLAAVGLSLSAVNFHIIVILCALLACFSVLEAFHEEWLLAGLAGVVVAYLMFTAVREIAAWWARKVETQLIDAIDIMVSALQGSENPTQAILTAAQVSPRVVKRELTEVVERLRLGLPIERAVRRLLLRYDSEGVRLFTQTLVAKWYVGGDLGPLLKSVNRIIRERVKLRLHLNGQLAGARYSSVAMAVLPYLLIPVLIWRQPNWIETLTTHPLGPPLLVLAISLQLVSFLWLRRLLRLDA